MLDLTSLSVSGLLFKRYFTSLSVSGHLFSAWSYISVIDLTILYISDLLFLRIISVSDLLFLLDLTILYVSVLLFRRILSVSDLLILHDLTILYISVLGLTILYVSDLLFLKLLSISDPISLLDLEKTRKEWDEISKRYVCKMEKLCWIVSHALILTWNTSVSKIIVRNNFPCLCHDCQSELRINMFMLFSHLLEAMTSEVLSELPSTSFQIPVH